MHRSFVQLPVAVWARRARSQLHSRSRATAKARIAIMAAKVSGESRRVWMPKMTRTRAVAAIPVPITTGLELVSRRRRNAASEVIRKMPRATTLPSDAMAVRSTRLAKSSTRPTEITSPRVPPTRARWPKTGGDWPGSARVGGGPRGGGGGGWDRRGGGQQPRHRHHGEAGLPQRRLGRHREGGVAVVDHLLHRQGPEHPERHQDVQGGGDAQGQI